MVATIYHYHIAINVDGDEAIEYLRQKLDSEGYQSTFVEHGTFRWFYLIAPNGMNIEVCYSPATPVDFFERGMRRTQN